MAISFESPLRSYLFRLRSVESRANTHECFGYVSLGCHSRWTISRRRSSWKVWFHCAFWSDLASCMISWRSDCILGTSTGSITCFFESAGYRSPWYVAGCLEYLRSTSTVQIYITMQLLVLRDLQCMGTVKKSRPDLLISSCWFVYRSVLIKYFSKWLWQRLHIFRFCNFKILENCRPDFSRVTIC